MPYRREEPCWERGWVKKGQRTRRALLSNVGHPGCQSWCWRSPCPPVILSVRLVAEHPQIQFTLLLFGSRGIWSQIGAISYSSFQLFIFLWLLPFCSWDHKNCGKLFSPLYSPREISQIITVQRKGGISLNSMMFLLKWLEAQHFCLKWGESRQEKRHCIIHPNPQKSATDFFSHLFKQRTCLKKYRFSPPIKQIKSIIGTIFSLRE